MTRSSPIIKIAFPLILIFLVILGLLWLSFPVSATPNHQQGRDFPTPTLNPSTLEPVMVQQVGGALEKRLYPQETMGHFIVGETSAISEYPNGATFTVTIDAAVAIQQVTLFARYPHRSGTRVNAVPTNRPNEWQAILYDRPGQPPWQEFSFYWSITAINGEFIETSPHQFIYSDPTRVWFKAETPFLRLYWFGYAEEFAQVAMEGMSSIQERYILGFGQPLSYVPIAVLFPDLESFAEFTAGGETGAQQRAGFTSNELGMTIQRFIERGLPRTCPHYWSVAEQTLDWLYQVTLSTIAHEVAHLYQFENNINGPIWFTEGGATWFSVEPFRGRQEGLRENPQGLDLPTIQGVGPSTGSNTPNGCNALAYWVGASFFNYIYGLYGMDAIGQWQALIGQNYLMDDALIQTTGKTLAELEHDWRIYLGYAPEVYIMPTQPYRFPPTVTPFGR